MPLMVSLAADLPSEKLVSTLARPVSGFRISDGS